MHCTCAFCKNAGFSIFRVAIGAKSMFYVCLIICISDVFFIISSLFGIRIFLICYSAIVLATRVPTNFDICRQLANIYFVISIDLFILLLLFFAFLNAIVMPCYTWTFVQRFIMINANIFIIDNLYLVQCIYSIYCYFLMIYTRNRYEERKG